MLKKVLIWLILPTAFFITACSNTSIQEEKSSKDNSHENHSSNTEESKPASTEQPSDELQKKFAKPPSQFNDEANKNLNVENTKNTTRINSDDLVETAIDVSQTIWPATHKESQPGTVILVPDNHWQLSMASADLIHHPNNGPMLFIKDGKIPDETLKEIKRLQPIGNDDGTQVMIMGDTSDTITEQLNGYKVKQIKGDEPAQFAAGIDKLYADVAGEMPNSVIIVSSEDSAKDYSLPAINWIAHMPEPILFVEENDIPKATEEALKKRKKEDLNMYLLGPDKIISKETEKKLGNYGKVTRISGDTSVENAIAFAKFKDMSTNFGWGLDDPGHGISLISSSTPELALAAAPFSHMGKHAPLLWLEDGEPSEPIYEFLAEIRPTFSDNPQDGPYNHAFLTGTMNEISFKTQGILDEKLEITNESGGGHGGH